MNNINDLMILYIFQDNLNKFIDILNHGADIHYLDDYGLFLACSKGYLGIVSHILNFFSISEKSLGESLKSACVFNHLNIVIYLLENGSDPNYNNGAPLIWSLYKCHYDIAKLLIKNKADINIQNGLPLRICVDKGNLEMLKYLVDKGSDINGELLMGDHFKCIERYSRQIIVEYITPFLI